MADPTPAEMARRELARRELAKRGVTPVAPAEGPSLAGKVKDVLVDEPLDFAKKVASDPAAAAAGFSKFGTFGFDDDAAGMGATYGSIIQDLRDGKSMAQAIGNAAAANKQAKKDRRADTEAAAARSPESYGAGALAGTALTVPLGGAAARSAQGVRVAASGAPVAALAVPVATTAVQRAAAAAPAAVAGAVGLGDAATLSGDLKNAAAGLATAPLAGVLPAAADDLRGLAGDAVATIEQQGVATAERNAAAQAARAANPAPVTAPSSLKDFAEPLQAAAQRVAALPPKKRWLLKQVPVVGKYIDSLDELSKILADDAGEEATKKLPKEAREAIDDIFREASEAPSTSAAPASAVTESAPPAAAPAAPKPPAVKFTAPVEDAPAPAPVVEAPPAPAPVAAAPSSPVVKEPWQMTRAELERFEMPSSGEMTGDLPAFGSTRIDPVLGYVETLENVPIKDLSFLEDVTDPAIKKSVTEYAEKYRAGKRPFPASMVRTEKGTLRTLNRRRVLAAKEAGLTEVPGWVSGKTHEEIVRDAVAAGKPVPAEVLAEYGIKAPTSSPVIPKGPPNITSSAFPPDAPLPRDVLSEAEYMEGRMTEALRSPEQFNPNGKFSRMRASESIRKPSKGSLQRFNEQAAGEGGAAQVELGTGPAPSGSAPGAGLVSDAQIVETAEALKAMGPTEQAQALAAIRATFGADDTKKLMRILGFLDDGVAPLTKKASR